jgi:predicted Zn-dependent protease
MAAKADPNAIEPVAALARLDLAAGKPERALADLSARIDAAKEPATARVLRGQVYLSMKRPDDAIVDFTTAIKEQPRLVAAYRGLASAQLARGKPDEAIKALRSGLAATKGSPVLALQLGVVLEGQGQFDAAAQVYESALDRDPYEDSAANNLAMLLANHRTDKASLERALDLVKRFENSVNPAYLDTRGWVLYRSGKYPEAIEALQQAVQRAPGQREFRYHLGLAQLKAGQTQEARSNLAAAVAEGTAYPGIDEARALLKGL